VFAAVLAGPQSNRAGLCKTQDTSEKSRRAHRRWPLAAHWRSPGHLHSRRMRQLSPKRRICFYLNLKGSSRPAPPPVHPAELRFQDDEARLSVRANVRNVPPLFPLARVILEPARRRPVRHVVVFRHPPAHRARFVVLIPWEAVGG